MSRLAPLPSSVFGFLPACCLVAAAVSAGCSADPAPTWSAASVARRPVARASGRVPDVTRQPQAFHTSRQTGFPGIRDLAPAPVTLLHRPAATPLDAAGIVPASAAVPAEMVPDPAAQPARSELSGPAPQPSGQPQPPAVSEIRGMMRNYLRAFNRHDPAALAAHWTGAGESVDLDSGEVTAGREAVRAVFAALFERDDEATIDIDVHSVRPVRDDVAVVDGVTLIAFADGAPAASRFSAVVVKEDGRWLLESVRETAQPAAAVAAAGRQLDALEWLLGAWEDIGEGVLASTQCFWSGGRGFLIRSHAIRGDVAGTDRPIAGDARIPGLLSPGDPQPRELTEIIGWDPDRRVIRSWIFTSSGRFAEGTWTRDGDRWTVLVEGRGRDEGASCTCTLAPAGADGLAFTCEGDALADLVPPACEFLRTAVLD